MKCSRIKNYKQWFIKLWIFYMEYSAYNNSLGINIDFRLFQYSNKKLKDVFRPVIYIEIWLAFLGSISFSIFNNNS